MPQAKGTNVGIVYDRELTYKTVPTSTAGWTLTFVSESIQSSRDMIDSNSIRGSRNALTPILGNHNVTGDINMELCPLTIGRFLYFALGTVTTTGASSPYTHTYKVHTDLPSFILQKNFADLTTTYFRFGGCKVNSMKMSFKPGSMIETAFSVVGATFSSSTSSYSIGQFATGGFTPFTSFQAVVKDGGSTLGNVTEVEFTLENNLDDSVFVLDGTPNRYSLPEGRVKVSGTMKCLFENTTLLTKALASTESAIQIVLTRGTGAGTVTNEILTIDLPEILYQPQTPVVPGPTGIFVELPFTAYYDNDSNGTTLMMTLKNALSTVQ